MDDKPNTQAAFAAGLAAPQPAELISGKDDAHGCNVGASFDQVKTDAEFCPDATAKRKRFEGLRAGLALAGGHTLNQLADGTFLVVFRHLTRALKDLDDVAALARQVGVRE